MAICKSCLEECEEVTIRDGFYYDYGSITGAWHDESYEGSSCCGEPVVEGSVFFDKTNYHIARKDHKNSKIKEGDLYRSTLKKGYYIDDDGHHAIYEYSKGIIATKQTLEEGEFRFIREWMFRWECKTCHKKYPTRPKDRKCYECARIEQEAMSLIGEVEV